jgi:hypothetical protein
VRVVVAPVGAEVFVVFGAPVVVGAVVAIVVVVVVGGAVVVVAAPRTVKVSVALPESRPRASRVWRPGEAPAGTPAE